MVKKILIALSYIVVIGAGVFGTLHFKNLNDKQVATNTQLNAQMASVQAELDSIGALTTVYQVKAGVDQTHTLTEDDIIDVSVPVSTLGDSSITDKSELIGKKTRIPVTTGTDLTKDILMEADEVQYKYWREITLPYLPIRLNVGDYIDIFAQLCNGESIPIMSHKEVYNIDDLTVTLKLSYEEMLCWEAAKQDYALFGNYGFVIYPAMYIAPGIDTTVAFYPVQEDTENMIKFDMNVSDYTRCVNTTLRQHIDLVNAMGTTDTNSQLSPLISELYGNEADKMNQLREQRIEQEEAAKQAEEEEAALDVSSEEYESAEGALDAATGEAMDSLDSSIDDLSIIE